MKALCVKQIKTEYDSKSFAVSQDTLECIGCRSPEEAAVLFAVCGGLKEPQSGTVEVFGRNLYRMDSEERALFRRRNIGLAGRRNNLLSGLSLYENIILPLELDGRQADPADAKRLAAMADLKAGLNAKPDRVSAASEQKAAVMRAVLAGASLLLVEREPDMEYQAARDVMRFVRYAQEEYGMTAVIFGETPEKWK